MEAGLPWILPTAAATTCWAFSDLCSDYCIEQKSDDRFVANNCAVEDKKRKPAKKKTALLKTSLLPRRRQLCGEQKAFLSGMTTFLFGCLGLGGVRFNDLHAVPMPIDIVFLSLVAGGLHFISYYYTLKAYNNAPSTIVTPLLQLSAVFMLPLSILAAFFGVSDRPVISLIHLQAVVFICIGGFLPLVEGDFTRFLTQRFWKHPVLRYCAVAEILVCTYNLLLHHLTYKTEHAQAVFSLTMFGNGMASLAVFLACPRIDHVSSIVTDVDPTYVGVAVFGECMSLCGLWIGNASYVHFYEPAVINAAEGGLQQMFNLVLAMAAYSCMPDGRKVTEIPIKIFSVCMVTFGLYLSTL